MNILPVPERGTRARNLLQQLTFSEETKPCEQDPEGWWATDLAGVNQAKRICNGHGGWPPCPLLKICREYAVVSIEADGVWGGTSPADRRTIRRRRYYKERQRLLALEASQPQELEAA